MIETKISKWCLIRAVSMTIFFILLSMPLYVDQDHNHQDVFNPIKFVYVLFSVIAGSILFTYITTLPIPKLVIEEAHIKISEGLKINSERFEFNDICGMNRVHKNSRYSFISGPFIRSNEQDFTVHFRNGKQATFFRKHYDNYEDIKMWFFVYCKEKELLKIDPLAVKRRSQYRRPEVKKL